jgi:hypothetical protein
LKSGDGGIAPASDHDDQVERVARGVGVGFFGALVCLGLHPSDCLFPSSFASALGGFRREKAR